MRKVLHTCIANQAYYEKDQYPAGVEAKGTGDGQHEAAVEKKTVGSPLLSELETEQDLFGMALLSERYSQLLVEIREGKHF